MLKSESAIHQLAADYAKIQGKLCRTMMSKFALSSDQSVLIDAPKSGDVEVDGEVWLFQRHGLGFRFENAATGVIVDAHRCVVSFPRAVDEWRLLQFVESLSRSRVEKLQRQSEPDWKREVKAFLLSAGEGSAATPIVGITGLYAIKDKPEDLWANGPLDNL